MSGTRPIFQREAGLIAAAAVTTVLVVGATVLRVGVEPSVAASLAERLVAVLVATALLLGALLALPRSASLAWAALCVAAGLAALEIVAVVRGLEPIAVGSARRDLAGISGLALVGSAAVAAGYAARRRGPSSVSARLAVIAVGFGVAAAAVACVWAVLDATGPVAAQTATDLTPRRIAARLGLVTLAAGFVVGATRDLGTPAIRAAARLRADEADAGGRLWRFLGLFLDELVPGRVGARREAAEAERARLAADLHATVLPDLRRVAAAAESSGVPVEVQVDLRRALEDVEQLMHQRQSIVLEQFGLIAALEWLAERTEERSRLRVELEVDDAIPEGPAAIDPPVARAAFRIALLALDNVVRHAGATTATLRLSATGQRLELIVLDNGTGEPFEGSGGRGLADMRTEAASTGGSITISSTPGARVEAIWHRALPAEHHAAGTAPLADRPG